MALLGEMRRRNIFKVSLAYAIVSWLVVQIADVLLPAFNAPQAVMQILVLVLILLFPIAVLLAWAYELTPKGFKPTADVDRTQSITVRTGQKLNHIVVFLLFLAVGFILVDNYLIEEEAVVDPDFAYRQSIAVLPFANTSDAEENASFLADGIHDELLTRLAQISDLRVISRTSVLEYRDTAKNITDIGDELNVGSVVEGTVQRSGDSIRINVQLIDAETDEHVWADTFDRELSAANVFAIQSEIATAIADALEASLSGAERARLEAVPTENMAALEAYFEGRNYLGQRTVEGLRRAIELLELAVSLDSDFAAAWAGIAEGWLELPNFDPGTDPDKARREASSAAIRAVTADPSSPDALAALGWHLLLHNYDWEGAEEALRAALSVETTNVNALHWYSHLLSWQGKHADAVTAAELAVEADPLSQLMQINLNYILLDARRWDEAFEIAERLQADGENSSLLANSMIGLLRARMAEEAAAMLLAWSEATGRDRDAAVEVGELIIAAQALGEPAVLTDDLIQRLGTASVAEFHAALGDAERTLDALEHAYQTGTGFRSLLSMRINPSFDFVREDPRFVALLEEIGLSD